MGSERFNKVSIWKGLKRTPAVQQSRLLPNYLHNNLHFIVGINTSGYCFVRPNYVIFNFQIHLILSVILSFNFSSDQAKRCVHACVHACVSAENIMDANDTLAFQCLASVSFTLHLDWLHPPAQSINASVSTNIIAIMPHGGWSELLNPTVTNLSGVTSVWIVYSC